MAILPTVYGKSLVFHSLPWIISVKSKEEKNIVLVVCALSSIIRDQISGLKERGIRVDSLPNVMEDGNYKKLNSDLFIDDTNKSDSDINISKKILEGNIDILFGHPANHF